MPENESQLQPGKESTGIQLLSPTLQQSIQNSTSKLSTSHPTEYFGWSTTPPDGNASPQVVNSEDEKDATNPATFDFDGFTLESVRGRVKTDEQNVQPSSTNRVSRTDNTADYCAFYYEENTQPNPLSCSMRSIRTATTTEDFEMSRRLQQESFQKQNQLTTKNRSTLSSTAAAAGFPMAKKKELTAVAMRGWLQKRKGLVLKRWKQYYCLFKSDDTLCLYASEDTVNGRLEQRYQVLRVVLTDKNDSFHIIGVDSDGAPRREEFRASVSPEWNRWFQVLGRFFDNTSMNQALVRKPELTFAKAFTDNQDEEDDWIAKNLGVNQVPLTKNYQHFDERHSYFGHRKQSKAVVRNSFDGSGDEKTSTVSSSSAPSVSINVSHETQGKQGNQKLFDCPMIERRSQGTVPMLETRGSESKRGEIASSSFSWTK
ncbi:hypothetical protein PHMEG_00030631 [Phytophthora megakarya]|uniref:PH domain-containing protein n=1 Tax=Phytophthora megakarya TaxID=4795 RepID=A0A225UZX6_9STRA|nr:hypothetical protein PHMEG_00030631 [Phytophthora megakarya]